MTPTRELARMIGRLPGFVEALAPVVEQLPDYVARLDAAEGIAAAAGTAAAKAVAAETLAITLSHIEDLSATMRDFIEGTGTMPYYDTQVIGTVVTDAASLILPADNYRYGALVYAPDAIVTLGFGAPPVTGAEYPIDSVGPIYVDVINRYPVFAKARWRDPSRNDPVSVPLSLRVRRNTGDELPTITFADRRLTLWPDGSDPRFYFALRTAINAVYEAGDWDHICYLFVAGATEANNALDLVDPRRAGLTYIRGAGGTGITTVPYSHVKGNGSDAIVSTGLSSTALALTFDNHALFCLTDGALVTASGFAVGISGSLAINPLQTATTAGARTGSATDQFTSDGDDIVGFSRLSSTQYQPYVNGVPNGAPVSRTLSAISDFILHLGGVGSSSESFGAPSAKGNRFILAGRNMNPARVLRIHNAFAPVLAIMATIRAEMA